MIKVLIVDDEELICTGIKSMIERLGNSAISEIHTAFDGEEGLELYNKYKPEIIITDIRMPGISGIEMIKKLKEMNTSSKIIILSGYSDFEYAREAMKLGALDYLLKPASMAELKEVMEKALQGIKLENSSAFGIPQDGTAVTKTAGNSEEKTVIGFAKKVHS